MKMPKYHIYLTNEERSEVLKSLFKGSKTGSFVFDIIECIKKED